MKMLKRDLVVFDLETTGVNVAVDRIVQIGAVRISPTGSKKEFSSFINPMMSIPAAATSIHRIKDHMVATSPTFAERVDDVSEFFRDADIGGFNISKFDIPLLQAEYKRCGKQFNMEGVHLYDALAIYHKYHPRDLVAALQTYCNREHCNPHDALHDVRATVDVMEAQITAHDLPDSIEGIHELCLGNNVTMDGRLKWNSQGEACFAFGKYAGISLEHVTMADSGYLHWILRGSFAEETKNIVARALGGECPERVADKSSIAHSSDPLQ